MRYNLEKLRHCALFDNRIKGHDWSSARMVLNVLPNQDVINVSTLLV